jgi:hypothetical protein
MHRSVVTFATSFLCRVGPVPDTSSPRVLVPGCSIGVGSELARRARGDAPRLAFVASRSRWSWAVDRQILRCAKESRISLTPAGAGRGVRGYRAVARGRGRAVRRRAHGGCTRDGHGHRIRVDLGLGLRAAGVTAPVSRPYPFGLPSSRNDLDRLDELTDGHRRADRRRSRARRVAAAVPRGVVPQRDGGSRKGSQR